ncbi:hypothetical protein YC2023_033176 [Brassica napus]
MHGRDEARHSQISTCDGRFSPYIDQQTSTATSKHRSITDYKHRKDSELHCPSTSSISIDRKRNNKSTDIHEQTSVDEASNRARLVQKVTSDMSDTHNRGEEISADTYARHMRHQFTLESLGDRMQNIEYATTIMKDKWRIGDEAVRDFTGTWFNKRKEEMETCFATSATFQHH